MHTTFFVFELLPSNYFTHEVCVYKKKQPKSMLAFSFYYIYNLSFHLQYINPSFAIVYIYKFVNTIKYFIYWIQTINENTRNEFRWTFVEGFHVMALEGCFLIVNIIRIYFSNTYRRRYICVNVDISIIISIWYAYLSKYNKSCTYLVTYTSNFLMEYYMYKELI